MNAGELAWHAGEQTPGRARDLAESAEAAVRALVYATAPNGGGVAEPEDVAVILERLRTTLGHLPQLTEQLTARLNALHDAGQLTSDRGYQAAAVSALNSIAAVAAEVNEHTHPRSLLIRALDQGVNSAKSLARTERDR